MIAKEMPLEKTTRFSEDTRKSRRALDCIEYIWVTEMRRQAYYGQKLTEEVSPFWKNQVDMEVWLRFSYLFSKSYSKGASTVTIRKSYMNAGDGLVSPYRAISLDSKTLGSFEVAVGPFGSTEILNGVLLA